ncbi:hypothetical protein PYW08_010483 [Mythimna loreyi]|uniref:Uncharacterized protein n=1 Tax=Mythimna loreyi TaxID=667449 RepID=A0ACC2Q576_9NEOP|nr:hypothetical protein PYW08_010483 [Mythimna loreyi]
MKLLVFFTASLLAGLAYSAPASDNVIAESLNKDTLTITEDFFPDSLAVYTADHDIVKILTPLNALNFEDDTDEDTDEGSDSDTVTFIVLADVQENGNKVDQGLYRLKNGQSTKLLDNGRDAAASNDDTKTAYFAASDGIYSYNAAENKAEKYGTVTDDLISIAKVNGSDVIYALTAANVLLKVTEEGTKKEVVDKVVNAQEIILDYQNNLYYYTNDKTVYVLVGDEVRKIEGLPANPSYLNIINPPFVIENGVPVIVDNKSYIVYENGTSETGDIEFVVRPSAYSMEATLIQYYGYNKKVYEYNILSIILGEVLSEFKSFLDDMTDTIQSIATRSRSDLRA